ncbi:MAG: ArgE/DapE family deacylase [Gemmatimonadetes bacterium]|nr:ArgE/DapE family deacylase [Gemmatimonadota bacterium]
MASRSGSVSGVNERAASGDPVALAQALVAIPSVNPRLEKGGAGERGIAEVCAGWLEDWGFDVAVAEPAPRRMNVLARLGAGERRLVLNGHLDTVGVGGMTIDPFAAEVRDGRLLGRGACDMKGGIAALLAAARRIAAAGEPGGELTIALTSDEEHASIGMRALVEAGFRAEAAVVCEPTGLAVMPAHKGFVWVEAVFRGRAAHGSRPDLGVDAIRHAARYLAALDGYERKLDRRPAHRLLGRPSFHAGTIEGGAAPSVYPAECRLLLERRTLPGEEPEAVVREFRAVLERLRRKIPGLDAELVRGVSQPATEVPAGAPVVRGLAAALRGEGLAPRIAGMTAWVDAALLNVAGIPAVCFGPGSIEQAHTADEWAPIDEIAKAANVLERFALSFLAGGAAS